MTSAKAQRRSSRSLHHLVLATSACVLTCVAGCGGPTVEVQPTFSVVHTAPHHGAIEVALDVVPYIAFSTAVGRDAGDAIRLEEVTPNGAAVVELTHFVDDQGLSVRLVPRRRLEECAEYRLVVDPDLTADNGAELGASWSSSFRTLEN